MLSAIAGATGCRLEWLANGTGPMMGTEPERTTHVTHFSVTGGSSGQESESAGAEVTRLGRGVARLYHDLPDLVSRALADDLQRVIRIHLGKDSADVERISFFLQGADPGEKKAGLGTREDARVVRGGRGALQLTED